MKHSFSIWCALALAAIVGQFALWPAKADTAGGALLFNAFTPQTGNELWRSDGTAAGTQMLQDIVPGPESSNPSGFISAWQQFLLTADTPGVGRELWALAQNAPGQPTPTPTLAPGQPTPTLAPGRAPASSMLLPLVRR